MKPKVLITGPPRCGKSTLISKLLAHYKEKGLNISGFFTPEVRKGGNRIGFDIQDIRSEQQIPLARVGYESSHKVGKYGVYIKEFNQYLEDALQIEDIDIIIIDEIGKMELFSEKFKNILPKIFQFDIPIIATIAEKLNHPIKTKVLNLPTVQLFKLSIQNREEIYNKILTLFQ